MSLRSWIFYFGIQISLILSKKNQWASRKLLYFVNWHWVGPTKNGYNSRKWNLVNFWSAAKLNEVWMHNLKFKSWIYSITEDQLLGQIGGLTNLKRKNKDFRTWWVRLKFIKDLKNKVPHFRNLQFVRRSAFAHRD